MDCLDQLAIIDVSSNVLYNVSPCRIEPVEQPITIYSQDFILQSICQLFGMQISQQLGDGVLKIGEDIKAEWLIDSYLRGDL